jgi:hypothetical protein
VAAGSSNIASRWFRVPETRRKRLRIGQTLALPTPVVRVGGLPAGRYRATLVAVRADGAESAPAVLLFEVV